MILQTFEDILSFDLNRIGELPSKEAKRVFEIRFLYEKLKRNYWNITNTAKELGISVTALHVRLNKLGIRDKVTKAKRLG